MKLFYGIQESEMTAMLGCIGAYLKEYKKNQYIITLEENVEAVGILLSGKVDMIKEDLWGNKTLLVSMQQGDLFGESFSCWHCKKRYGFFRDRYIVYHIISAFFPYFANL